MSNTEPIPVVIIGAGPAGLTAALFLARQGINVQVIERHPGTSIHPRARGLNVRTMEIYRSVGLEAAIEHAGAALAASKHMLFVETLAGREIRRTPMTISSPLAMRSLPLLPSYRVARTIRMYWCASTGMDRFKSVLLHP